MLKLLDGLDAEQRQRFYKSWALSLRSSSDKLRGITWQQRLGLARTAIKDLASDDVRLRDSANDVLHELSFKLFSEGNNANPIRNTDFMQDDSSGLLERWKTAWDQADSIQQRSEFDDTSIESHPSELLLVAYGDFGNQQRAIHRMSALLANRKDISDPIAEFQESIRELRSKHANSHVMVSLLSPKASEQRKALTMITSSYPHIKNQICATWDAKYKFATSDLIPLLKSPEKKVRELAEESLHRISFGVFVGRIPVVSHEKWYSREVNEIIDRWHDQWNQANAHYDSKDLSDLFDEGNEAKLLA